MNIIIVGAGLAGLASTLSLLKHVVPRPKVILVELRSTLSPLGNAIGLTPNALRALQHIGVLEKVREKALGCDVSKIDLFALYSGSRLGEISFIGGVGEKGGEGIGENGSKFKGLRIMRKDLATAMMECVKEKEGVTVLWGKKTVSIEESEQHVTVKFEDGGQVTGDLLVGGDGIHSVVRSLLVEPERKPEYTGIAAVCGFSDTAVLEESGHDILWDTTGLVQSKRGSLLCTFCDQEKKRVMLSTIMEASEVQGKEGWRAREAEQEEIKKDVWDRYHGGPIGCLDLLMEKSTDWSLYPVFKLGPGGRWSTRRTILLGDAAHAMPPQGESGGIALDDAILFARVVAALPEQPLTDRFAAFEKLRRSHIDQAYQQATFGWDTQKDSGWAAFYFRSWLTVLFLWWTASGRQKRYAEDIATQNLGLN